MNHVTAELDQTDEDILNEVSDETLEDSGGRLHRGPIRGDCWTNNHDGRMLLIWEPGRTTSATIARAAKGRSNAGRAADQSFPRFLSCLLRPSKKYCTGTSSISAS